MLAPVLVLMALLFFSLPWISEEQQASKPETAASAPAPTPATSVPAGAASLPNPVHPTTESQARAKHIYGVDCSVCHGADGSGKGDITMTAKMPDFRDPASLKSFTDGQLFYLIKNGDGDMPPEGDRAKPDETWNLVIYVRSFSK